GNLPRTTVGSMIPMGLRPFRPEPKWLTNDTGRRHLVALRLGRKYSRMNSSPQRSRFVLFFALLAGTALAQSGQDSSVTYTPVAPATPTAGKAPSVTMAPVPVVTAPRTMQTMVNMNFRVAHGFHINSNTPKSEFLIPTALKMDVPTDIALGKI